MKLGDGNVRENKMYEDERTTTEDGDMQKVQRWKRMVHDKWKLPTPSCIATRNLSFITALDEYSGSFR